MTPAFTVIIGTLGRAGLPYTLASIKRQRRVPGDQCIVAIDTHRDTSGLRETDTRALVESFGEGFISVSYDAGYGFFGVEQINHALRTVPITGSHVFTLGDDDVFVDGAYNTLRAVCATDPLRPVLFRFLAPWHELLWDVPQFRMSRISGCCIAAPTKFVGPMDTKTTWPDGKTPFVEHDYFWMENIIRESGQEPLWLDDVLVIARPEKRGEDVTHQPLVRCWHCHYYRYGEDVPITEIKCPKCSAVLPVKGVKEVAA